MEAKDVFAVFQAGGKQYRAKKGDLLKLNRVTDEPGKEISINEILMLDSNAADSSSDGEVKIGAPYVPGASVTLRVVRHLKGPKVRIFKKRRRKGYTRRKGHRQSITEVMVDNIVSA